MADSKQQKAVDDMVAGLREIAKRTKESSGYVNDMLDGFQQITSTKTFAAVSAAVGLPREKLNQYLKLASEAFGVSKQEAKVIKQRSALLDESVRILAARYKAATGAAKEQLGTLLLETNEMRAQVGFQSKLARLTSERGHITLLGIRTTAAALVTVINMHRQINDALKQSIQLESQRWTLVGAVSEVQTQQGVTLGQANRAMAALVAYGYDLKGDLSGSLKATVMLEDALGLSADRSAEMLVTYRRLNTQASQIADVIAAIASDTALGADEAARYATEVGKAMLLLNPAGTGRGLAAGVAGALGRFEGAAKLVTGMSGDMTRLISQLSSSKGLITGGTLGVSPDVIRTEQGVKTVIERTGKYIQTVLGNATGWDRALRLDLLSEQLGISRELVSNYADVMKELNSQVNSGTSIQKAYQLQNRELTSAIGKLTNSLVGLLQQAATPLLKILIPMVNGVTYLVEGLARFKGAVYAAGALVLSAAAYTTVQFGRLAAAIISEGAALSAVRKVLALAPGSSALLTRFIPMVLRSVIPITAAALGGWALGSLLDPFLDKWEALLIPGLAPLVYLKKISAYLGEMSVSQRPDTYRAALSNARGRSFMQVLNDMSDMIRSGQSSDAIRKFLEAQTPNLRAVKTASEDRKDLMVAKFYERAEARAKELGVELQTAAAFKGVFGLGDLNISGQERIRGSVENLTAIIRQLHDKTVAKSLDAEARRKQLLENLEIRRRLDSSVSQMWMHNMFVPDPGTMGMTVLSAEE